MDTKNRDFFKDCEVEFCKRSYDKFIKGAEQHGGHLWEKKNIIDMAMDEVIDQWIYLYALKRQINNKTIYEVTGVDKD